MSFDDLPRVLAAVLTLAVVLAWLRLLLWQRGSPGGQRSRMWRLIVLLLLQPLCAALLYFTLLPPTRPGEAGTMVVATAGTTAAQVRGIDAADHIVALPEAGDLTEAERVPDLATALRRHPGTRRLRLIGAGLEARDREAAPGLSIEFEPPAISPGVMRFDPPARVAPGSTFQLGGRVHGGDGGSVELLDPAGQRVDVAKLDKDGEFTLSGSARDAGLAMLTLRVRGADGKQLEDVAVPLWTAEDPAPRLLILAGGPGPELKFLRRWATDAGLQSRVQVSVGGGLQLGDAPLPLNAGTLLEFDMVIVDERSWGALGAGQRAALGAAVRDGLGLLLRVTGPLPATTRSQWQALGLDVAGGSDSAVLKLGANVVDDDALRALRGPGSRDVPISADADQAQPPELTRRVVRVDSAQAVPLLRAANGTPFAHWRAAGLGRVGVSTVTDSYLLALAGRHDLHAQLWSEAFGTLARPATAAAPRFSSPMRIDERMSVCGLDEAPQVRAPDGSRTALLLDHAAGSHACAGYWPDETGWHELQQGDERWPFHVSDREAAPGVLAAELQDATLQLAQQGVTSAAPRGATSAPPRRGSPWPWFLAWMLAAAALWWLERARPGRTAQPVDLRSPTR